jgi:hypothetical protein
MAIAHIEEQEAARMTIVVRHGRDKRTRKQIRAFERSFFQRRTQLIELLRSVHDQFETRVAA